MKKVGEACLILPDTALSPKGQLSLFKGGKIPTIPCLVPGQRPRGDAGLAHRAYPLPLAGSGLFSHPWTTLPTNPPLLSTVTWATQVNAWLDGCGFPRRQWCTRGQQPTSPQPPFSGGVWSWSCDFGADNLLNAPLLSRGKGNWRGHDILCDAPECTPHQTETKRAPKEKPAPLHSPK